MQVKFVRVKMKLKKFLKSGEKKTYLQGERTYKVKHKMKKLKHVLEEETKNTIEKSKRKESVYTPLEDNTTFELQVTEKTKSKTKKRKQVGINLLKLRTSRVVVK